MHATLEKARRFQGLLELKDHDAPYAFETIFSQHNWSARRRSKQKFKLLRRLDEKLRAMLNEGERVRYLTSGAAVSFWESYFLGWAVHLLNRRAIVVTDRRILLIQIDSRLRPKELIAQLRYPVIAKVKRSVLGNTVFKLGNGKSRVLSGVPGADRKFLQNLSSWTSRALQPESAGIEDLCPHCYEPVLGRPPACGSCSGPFKSAARAGLLSLLFPGLGDLYLGHWKFAIWEIAVAAAVWLIMLLPDPQYPLTPAALLVAAAFLVIFVHGVDAVATWYIGKQGIYPASTRR